MKIVLCSDHAGFELKEKIKGFLCEKSSDFGSENALNVQDIGAKEYEKTDSYVDYAKLANKEIVQSNEHCFGIYICGSGVGMNIVANKQVGIRSVLAFEKELAKLSREHNNCNVLCLGANFINFEQAKSIISTFINTNFLGERHEKRVESIE